MSDAAGYSLYELLETLIHRVAWPSEGEKNKALDSVTTMRTVMLFGNMAELITCKHERTTYNPGVGHTTIGRSAFRNPGTNKCLDCGRNVG